jgi:hypothetical protein
MKNIFLLLFILIVTVSTSLSQQLSLGAKLGYCSAGINKSEAGKQSVNGPVVGGVINLSFNKLFSLQLEGNYQLKGGGYGFKISGKKYSDYFKFKTIEFPLLAKFTIGEKKVKFIGLMGPYVGYTLNIERRFQDPDAGVNTTTHYDNYTFFDNDGVKSNRFDAGFAIGTGFSIDLGKGRLFVEGRYTIGVAKWFKLNPMTFSNKQLNDLSHRAMTISVGYTMPIWSRTE